MIDRQLIGDMVLAALIAVPIAVLAQPEVAPHGHHSKASPPQQKSAMVLASAADREIGLFR